MTLLVGDDDAVGVAIEGDADIGAHLAHLGGERRRGGRADLLVEVEVVRLDADGEGLGAELLKRKWQYLVGSASAFSIM